jgi:two-component system nitrate/nitrite response regulator NarL
MTAVEVDVRRPTVLVVGRDDWKRAGVRVALRTTANCVEARTATEAAEVATRVTPEVCLVNADAETGMALVANVADAIPSARVVVLAASPREDQLLAAVRAGAVGYLSDEVDPARLPFVVLGVLHGEAAIPRALVTRILDELRERRRRRLQLRGATGPIDLTLREWQVLDELRRGATTKEIAHQLEISDVTVRRHIGALIKKLGVPNRKAALALVAETSLS